ncbi:unnamed protein product, partial [marine sediment metagenome]
LNHLEEPAPPPKSEERPMPPKPKVEQKPKATAYEKLMELADGGDYLEIFGSAGHGKSRFLSHVALEAKRAGLKVKFMDCEHSISNRIKKELGDSYQRLGFMDFDKLLDVFANLPKGYDLILFDSLGFPVLIKYAMMKFRQRGDAILKTILLRGYLKDYAETNHVLSLGANQPKSELWGASHGVEAENLEEKLGPVGGKSIHVAKGVIRMSIEDRTEEKTVFGLRAFECQDLPFNKLIATFTISGEGEKVEWKI